MKRGVILLVVTAVLLVVLAACGGQPQIAVAENRLQLGDVVNGEVVTRQVSVQNNGAADLVIENINVGKAKRVLDIRGFPAADISGVRFYNSTIKGITQNDSVKDGDVKLVDCVVERQQ